MSIKAGIIETAKSIQNLTNILTALVFFRHYWESQDLISLLFAALVLFNGYGISLWMFARMGREEL